MVPQYWEEDQSFINWIYLLRFNFLCMVLPYIWKETLKGVPENKCSLKLKKVLVMQKEQNHLSDIWLLYKQLNVMHTIMSLKLQKKNLIILILSCILGCRIYYQKLGAVYYIRRYTILLIIFSKMILMFLAELLK